MTSPTPEPCNCSALRQASRHVTRLYDDALAPAGLGLNQYSVLSKLHRHGPMDQGALARLLVMDRSTIGHLLGPLQRRCWIAIAPAETDRRRRMVSLTETGAALLETARPLWAKAECAFEHAFGAESATTLRHALKQVTQTRLTLPL